MNLGALFTDAVARLGHQPVLFVAGSAWSWQDLLGRAAGIAMDWRAAGLGPGDRVVIDLANGVAHLLTELAAWCVGAIPAPLTPSLGGQDRATVIARLAPTLLIDRLHEAALLSTTPASWPADIPGDHHSPCLILHTSGSTGVPRGVVLTQGNICSQQAAFAQLWPDVGSADRLASYLPWYHSFGALAERLWALLRGAQMHLVPGDGHDHEALLRTVADVRPTRFMSVPKLHHLVCSEGVLDLEHLRWVFTAGAPLGPEASACYARQGVPVLEGWGLTECSPSATITLGARQPPAVGQPIPGVGVGVAEDHRILIRGPGVMAGYWHDDQATASVLKDGVLCSGDLGCWGPDGLELLGRADHLLKHPNGEKIPAAVIEQALTARPGVELALVFIDDQRQALGAILLGAAAACATAIADHNSHEPTPWWRIRRGWRLCVNPSVDNGLATGSHKPDRAAICRLLTMADERLEPIGLG